MDKTYLPILTQLLSDQESDELEQQQLLQDFQDIIGVIILLAVPLSINALSRLLRIGADKISNLLFTFQSVLSISGDRDLPVRILIYHFGIFWSGPELGFMWMSNKDIKKLLSTVFKPCRVIYRKISAI
jgi:hypothetical protein